MKEQIEQMYANARKISQDTGVAHEVDHIVPLVNSAVCGLHVPWNLQILTQFENRSKRNNLENING
jgi:5-methylcytosine-specific restriction endonuclease McrA